MNLKQTSDQEQTEAHIESANKWFEREMNRLEKRHTNAVRRIDFWAGAAQGGVIGFVLGFIAAVVWLAFKLK